MSSKRLSKGMESSRELAVQINMTFDKSTGSPT